MYVYIYIYMYICIYVYIYIYIYISIIYHNIRLRCVALKPYYKGMNFYTFC